MFIYGQECLSSHRDSSLAHYPLLLDVSTNTKDLRSRYEALRFAAMPSDRAALVRAIVSDSHETAGKA